VNLELCGQLALGGTVQAGYHQLIDLILRQASLDLTGSSGNWLSLLTSVSVARKARKSQRNRCVRKLSEKDHVGRLGLLWSGPVSLEVTQAS
jgi:hypothetical protein